MNKSFLFLGLASVMSAFTGCTTDEADNVTNPEQQPSTAPQTLVAQLQDDNATRVAMSPTGKTVRWQAGDAIAVYSADNETGKIRYKLKAGFEDQGVGEFELVPDQTGSISLAKYGTYDNGEEKTYVAIYPSSQFYQKQNSSFSPLELGAVIPNVQKYTKGSFDPKALPMMAVFQNSDTGNPSEFTTLKFKYMGALLRLPVSASQAATLESVQIVGKSEQYAKLAGTVYYQFYGSMFGNDKAGRDACYTDMTVPMNYKDEGRYTKTSETITLEGPIDISSTPTDLTFGILPYDYTGSQQSAKYLTFTFRYDDGSAIEKSTKNGTEVRPGDIAVMPEFKLQPPYMPVATIQNGELSWDGNEDVVESYQVVVSDWGEPMTTIDIWSVDDKIEGEDGTPQPKPAVTSINIADAILPKLDAFVGSNFLAGEEAFLDLQVKATYKGANKTYADAVYSVPVEINYTVPIPEIICDYRVEKYDYLDITNYAAYPKVEWARVLLSHQKPAVEADFTNATFKRVTSRYVQPIEYDGLDYGEYAYMIRASAADGTVLKTTYLYHEHAAPQAPDQELKIEIDPNAGSIRITNFMDLKDYYQPTATYIVYKEYDGVTPWTLISDFDDVQATNKYNFNNQGEIWLADMNFPGGDNYGNNDKYYSVLIVMEDDQFPDGSISIIDHFYNHFSE